MFYIGENILSDGMGLMSCKYETYFVGGQLDEQVFIFTFTFFYGHVKSGDPVQQNHPG